MTAFQRYYGTRRSLDSRPPLGTMTATDDPAIDSVESPQTPILRPAEVQHVYRLVSETGEVLRSQSLTVAKAVSDNLQAYNLGSKCRWVRDE